MQGIHSLENSGYLKEHIFLCFMFSSLLISFWKMAKLNCSAFQLHKFQKQNFTYKEHCATQRKKEADREGIVIVRAFKSYKPCKTL